MLEKHAFPLKVTFPVCMAPMVGLSHLALREVANSYMPAGTQTIWPSEMLSSRRLPSENIRETAEALHDEDEKFWVPQILGNEEKYIAPSVQKLADYGADGIDINMGCPVQKALKHNYGVALMGDVDYAAKVVEMTVRNTELPVSVKMRAGFENTSQNIVAFVKKLEDAGAAWITLHPRTAEQKRHGTADWDQIRAVKEALRIPVIGNGDVQVAQDVIDMKERTGCDLVMAGRALVARPWLLWQVGEKMGYPPPVGRSGLAPATPEEEGREFYHCALAVLETMKQRFKPNLVQRKYLFYIKTASVWLQFGHTLYSHVSKGKTPEEVERALHDFFKLEQAMVRRSEWRV
jgi:tRNA-dihydrouridine synthase B